MLLKKPSLAVAGVASLAFAFNNPAGHYAMNEMVLRVALADAHSYAQDFTGHRGLSFTDFKKDAGFYLMLYYNNDIEQVTAMMRKIGSTAQILCLPLDDSDNPTENNTMAPCHAVTNRKNNKVKADKPKVA